MSNNLPVETNNGIMSKIKNFFKKLFYRPQMDQVNLLENNDEKNNIIVPNSEIFSRNLSVTLEQNKSNIASGFVREKEKDDVIENLKKNPELMDEINIETLENIVRYYEKRVEDKRRMVKA